MGSRFSVPCLLGLLLALPSASSCLDSAPRRAPQSGPRRLALLAGGSGETEADNFLVQDLRDFRKRLIERGWQVNAVVGASDGALPGSVPAANAHLGRAVRDMLGAARAGDRVLLVFHSHGRQQESEWGQRSHSLVSEDRDASGTEPGFDLDSIEPALVGAGSRGVHVALVDLSCYSGATQALRGASCTVTLAAPRYVSLCSGRPEERHFTSRFLRLPEAGHPADVETQFLEARREDLDSLNLPQISALSTPAADGWDAYLEQVDPLDVYEDLKNLRTGTRPFDPGKLLGPLDVAIRRRGAASPALSTLRGRIAERLDRALRLRAALESAMPALAKDYDDRRIEVPVPGRPALLMAPADLADLLKNLEEGRDPERIEGYTHAQRTLAAAMQPDRSRIAERFAKPLSEFRARREAFDGLAQELERTSDELFNDERRLYDALVAPPAAGDPCREFAL